MTDLTHLEARTLRWMLEQNGRVSAPLGVGHAIHALTATRHVFVGVTKDGIAALEAYDRAQELARQDAGHRRRVAQGMSSAARARQHKEGER